jgi:molecular chaperone GrpE
MDQEDKKDLLTDNEVEDIIDNKITADEDDTSLIEKIRKLKAELKVCHKEKQEYLTGWQRAKADYLNLKKEEATQRTEIHKYAKADMLNDLIRLADSFEMAFANKTVWETAPENWRKGVEYIHSQLLIVFRDHGLEEINPLNEVFDPARDESIGTIETSKAGDENKILEVVKRGYRLNDKVIRPAQVRIGKVKD